MHNVIAPNRKAFSVLLIIGLVCGVARAVAANGIRKLQDVTIYADPQFHSAFPSIVRRPDGELLVAFRRAPDRRLLGSTGYTHTDPNSYLVMVRSRDDGCTWTKEPQIFFAHPFGGSQDPCMVQLRDNSIVCTSYAWSWMPSAALPKLPRPNTVQGGFAFLGGFVLRSLDGGSSWQAPVIPPRGAGEQRVDIFGRPLPAYNRGAMTEGRDGRLYWVVASRAEPGNARSATQLMISEDNGATWKYSGVVAQDAKVGFNETSILETPKGDLVAFMRTTDLGDHLAVARSSDHGKSFGKWEDVAWQGHPFYALRLPDDRVLLVYGYRHPPFGIRARVLDPECSDLATAPEVVLRDDGGGVDLGYPWATMIGRDRALVVYYFNRNDGPRTIEGTFVQVE